MSFEFVSQLSNKNPFESYTSELALSMVNSVGHYLMQQIQKLKMGKEKLKSVNSNENYNDKTYNDNVKTDNRNSNHSEKSKKSYSTVDTDSKEHTNTKLNKTNESNLSACLSNWSYATSISDYTLLINNSTSNSTHLELSDILLKIANQGLNPTIEIFNALLLNVYQTSNFLLAEEIKSEQFENVEPNEYTLHILIKIMGEKFKAKMADENFLNLGKEKEERLNNRFLCFYHKKKGKLSQNSNSDNILSDTNQESEDTSSDDNKSWKVYENWSDISDISDGSEDEKKKKIKNVVNVSSQHTSSSQSSTQIYSKNMINSNSSNKPKLSLRSIHSTPSLQKFLATQPTPTGHTTQNPHTTTNPNLTPSPYLHLFSTFDNELFSLIQLFESHNVYMDTFAQNSILKILTSMGRTEEAWVQFSNMLQFFQPNLESFMNALKIFKKKLGEKKNFSGKEKNLKDLKDFDEKWRKRFGEIVEMLEVKKIKSVKVLNGMLKIMNKIGGVMFEERVEQIFGEMKDRAYRRESYVSTCEHLSINLTTKVDEIEKNMHNISRRYINNFNVRNLNKNAINLYTEVINELTYAIMISYYSKKGLLSKAKEVFEDLKNTAKNSKNINPITVSVLSYEKIIKACISCNDITQAELYLKEMKYANIDPTIKVYFILLNGYRVKKDFNTAIQLYEKIKNEETVFQFNTTFYNSIIGICLDTGHHEKIIEIYLDFKQFAEDNSSSDSYVIQPNFQTYLMLLKGYTKLKKFPKVKDLLTFLKKQKQTTTYTDLLPTSLLYKIYELYSKNANLTDETVVLNIFNDLKTHQLNHGSTKLSLGLYSSLISYFSQNNHFNKAFNYFEECIKNGLSPNCSIYHVLISLQIKNNFTDRALTLFNNMLIKKIPCDTTLYELIIETCLINDRTTDAFTFTTQAIASCYINKKPISDKLVNRTLIDYIENDELKPYERKDGLAGFYQKINEQNMEFEMEEACIHVLAAFLVRKNFIVFEEKREDFTGYFGDNSRKSVNYGNGNYNYNYPDFSNDVNYNSNSNLQNSNLQNSNLNKTGTGSGARLNLKASPFIYVPTTNFTTRTNNSNQYKNTNQYNTNYSNTNQYNNNTNNSSVYNSNISNYNSSTTYNKYNDYNDCNDNNNYTNTKDNLTNQKSHNTNNNTNKNKKSIAWAGQSLYSVYN